MLRRWTGAVATTVSRSSLSKHTVRTMSSVQVSQTENAQDFRAHAEDRMLQMLNKLAAKSHAEGKLEQAEEMYQQLVASRRQRHGDQHPLTVYAIGSLSTVSMDRGDYEVAEDLAREAAHVFKATLGLAHPDSLQQLSNLTQVLTRQGKFEEAEAKARVVVEGYRSAFGEGHEALENAETDLKQVIAGRDRVGSP